VQVQNLDLKIEEAWLFDMWEFYVAIAKSRERKGLGIEPLQKNETAQFSTGAEEHTNKAMSFANAFLQSTGVATSSKKVYIRGKQVMLIFFVAADTPRYIHLRIRTYLGLLSSVTLVL
jgi:hypothetical protein